MKRWENTVLKSLIIVVAICLVLGNIQSATAAKQTEITVWKFGGAPAETEMWPVQTEIFAKENPDIKVKYEYFYGQIRVQKILGAYKSKKLPDVIVAFGQDLPDFVGLGIVQALDDIDAAAVESWKANILPEVYETGRYQGKMYALPTYVDMAPFLAVNLDALAPVNAVRRHIKPRFQTGCHQYLRHECRSRALTLCSCDMYGRITQVRVAQFFQ